MPQRWPVSRRKWGGVKGRLVSHYKHKGLTTSQAYVVSHCARVCVSLSVHIFYIFCILYKWMRVRLSPVIYIPLSLRIVPYFYLFHSLQNVVFIFLFVSRSKTILFSAWQTRFFGHQPNTNACRPPVAAV